MTQTLKRIAASLAAISLTISIFMATAPPTHATEHGRPQLVPCSIQKDMSKLLSKRFGETRQAWGIVGEQAIMEIYVAKSGTWSIVMTTLNGRSCVVAAGHSFDTISQKFAGEPT